LEFVGEEREERGKGRKRRGGRAERGSETHTALRVFSSAVKGVMLPQ
jgi:hypothetical protein